MKVDNTVDGASSAGPRFDRARGNLRPNVTSDELKALRSELGCTARELADALGVEHKMVVDWEAGERFPTKKHVGDLEALRRKGPGAIPRRARGAVPSPMRLLADPMLWSIVRKLLVHRPFREQVIKLAEGFADPEDGPS